MNNALYEKKHVLLISGVPRILAEIKMELMEHFEVSIAASNAVALAALVAYNISAVIIFISENNEEKAFTAFTGIFELVNSKKIPIIFLAEKGNDEDETAAFMIGAADYCVRRRGTISALINRIKLRISIGECERQFALGEIPEPAFEIKPEAILKDKTILIVDDVELNREIVGEMLSGIEGLSLDFAGDGTEAVEKFSEESDRYSLILMDVQMPGMNGLDATRAIRRLDRETAREIPIIALTGGASESEIQLCLKAGMDGYLEKPPAYDKLLTVITESFL